MVKEGEGGRGRGGRAEERRWGGGGKKGRRGGGRGETQRGGGGDITGGFQFC